MVRQELSIQTDDFSSAVEYEALRTPTVGAVVSFVGLVREFATSTEALYLEHYPGMTEKVIAELIESAKQRWDIAGVRLIHRIGPLLPGEQIVFVGVASAHRSCAFAACEFLIDKLKTEAPFWKKEGQHWVDAKLSDQQRAERWHAKENR